MQSYIVYRHQLNGKSYIGYTKKTLGKRLEEHIKESQCDSTRHFCRAITKYGAGNIKSSILFSTSDLAVAKRVERQMVKEYDSLKNGYNMTEGGTGGNTTVVYNEDQLRRYKKLCSRRSIGVSNPNASGKTREEILELALSVFLDNGNNWVKSDYQTRAKNLGYPINIGCSGMIAQPWQQDLINYAKTKNIMLAEIKYYPTTEHILNNSGTRKKGGKWYYNTKLKKSKYFNPDELHNATNDWQRGRKLKWD